MKGITILGGNQHTDHHTLVHHANPNCESYQEYKGIYNGNSTGVFNGRVLVEKVAQKINAFQQNNNLLVGDKSSVNTKPQLEIFADDVKCSHGSTSGSIDAEAIHYLMTRGIELRAAKKLLIKGFLNEIFENIPEEKIRTFLDKSIEVQIDEI